MDWTDMNSVGITIEATLGFEDAQRWLFFMVRALEFKWNTPFSGFAHDGRTWSAKTLFKLRNADELEAFSTP